MDTFFIILVVIGGLITLPLVLAAFSPKRFMITRDIVINKPRHEVFAFLRVLRNAEKFNKWVMTDPAMKKDTRGTDGNVGFVYAWDSTNKQVGKGEQEIIKMDENKRIDYELRFKKPFEATSYTWFILEDETETQTRVTWVFSGSNNYMMRVFHVILNLKKLLGHDMYISLNRLKLLIEN